MEPWVYLALVGVGFVILEIFTPSFFSLPAGLAFLATAALSPFLNLTWTLAALVLWLLIVYSAFYLYVWPRLEKKAPRTGAHGMIGQVATVTEPIDARAQTGYVKLYGDSWRALSTETFQVGDRVVILQTEGNKVVVGPTGG